MLGQPLANHAIRPRGLSAFPFVFWCTSPESIFHLNFMEMKWVINELSQNLGTCWLSFSPGFSGESGYSGNNCPKGSEDEVLEACFSVAQVMMSLFG